MANTQSVHKRKVTKGSTYKTPKLRFNPLFLVGTILALLLLLFLGDVIANWGKAYPGVHVGDIDVSGLTKEQIEDKIFQQYGESFNSASVVIYASEDAANSVNDQVKQQENRALAEQLAVEEAQANQLAWQVSTSDLEAYIPVEELAQKAIEVGRDNGGIEGRFSALVHTTTIDVKGIYNDQLLENLAQSIDEVIGSERVDWSVGVYDGVAYIITGSDGNMVNRDTLVTQLNSAYLSKEESASFIAVAEFAPSRTTEAQATEACDRLNKVLTGSNTFAYSGGSWELSQAELGSWIKVSIAEQGASWVITPYIDKSIAISSLTENLLAITGDSSLTISLDAGNQEDVRVHTSGNNTIPDSTHAVEEFNSQLFGDTSRSTGLLSDITIEVPSTEVSEDLSFDDALASGLIGEISSYTTEFSTIEGTENRNHNIALVSELLNNSVCKAGDTWSYNDTTGFCDESKGFLGAGAIVNGEYSDSVGGGICQVATTVFNAIYESGFPVTERHNHSLYISSYPQGRDAAVSYGELDLQWKNDSPNDVLIRVSCAEGSVTASFFGVNPGYQVESSVGDWEEGASYSTTYETDDSLSPGTSYVKTRGTDGRTITVVRSVYDRDGNLLREDAFGSVYDPVNEVIVKGPASQSESHNSDS